MTWTKDRHGIARWTGGPFPEPSEPELRPHGYYVKRKDRKSCETPTTYTLTEHYRRKERPCRSCGAVAKSLTDPRRYAVTR